MPDFFTWSYLDRCCVFVVEWLSLLSGCLPRSTTVTRWFAGLVDIPLNSGPRFQVEESKRKRKGEREKGRNERKEDVDEKRVEKWRRREKWEIKGRMKNMRGERRKWIPRSVYTAPQESTIATFSSDWSLLLPGSATQGCTLVQLTAARRSCLSCWSIDYLRLSICMWELKCNCRSSCHFPCRLVGTPLTSAPRRSWSKCCRTLWRICIMLDALVM